MMCCVELNHLVRLLINPRLVSAPLSVDGPIASWILHRNDNSDVPFASFAAMQWWRFIHGSRVIFYVDIGVGISLLPDRSRQNKRSEMARAWDGSVARR